MLSCHHPERPEHRDMPVEKMRAAGNRLDIDRSLLASANDTICGMSLSGGIYDTVRVDGRIFGFCSNVCKNSFLKMQGMEGKK